MAMLRHALGPACLIAMLIACQQGDLPANPAAKPPSADKIKQAVDTRNQVMDAGGGVAGAGAIQSDEAISGVVSLGQGVSLSPGGTLFIIARKQGESAGPPLAVLNLKPDAWPVSFSLSQGNVMLPNTPFEGAMSLKVRYDADGNAMTKSEEDIEMSWPAPVSPGAKNLSFVLGGKPGEAPAAAPQGAPMASGPAPKISGTIALAEGANPPKGAVLFVMARSGPSGPPVAVVRLEPTAFPMPFELTEANTMMAGTPFAGALNISARLDTDGDAMSKAPTDLVGESSGIVSVGSEGVSLVLSPLGDKAN